MANHEVAQGPVRPVWWHALLQRRMAPFVSLPGCLLIILAHKQFKVFAYPSVLMLLKSLNLRAVIELLYIP